jgi:Thioredoxin like C-terminal domain
MASISDREMQDIEAAIAPYQRMYQLIRQPGPIGDRRFEIEFLDAGGEAFVFTFGSQEGMGHYV